MEKKWKGIITLTFAALIVFSTVNLAGANSAAPSNGTLSYQDYLNNLRAGVPESNLSKEDLALKDNALLFLDQIAGLNVTNYKIGIRVDNEVAGIASGKTVILYLTSDSSKVDAITEFTSQGKLFWCTIYPIEGSPALSKPISLDILSVAKTTVDRLQTFSEKTYLPTFQSMLNSADKLENSTVTDSGFTQRIAVQGSDVTITWEPFSNNLSNPQNKLFLEFRNGQLVFFANYLDMYQIGNSEVKIQEKGAIAIAIQQVQAFSWVQGGIQVSNVTVLKDSIIANLSLQNKGNFSLYPLWDVWLPLEKMYAGGVTSFHVEIWADTGEVASITPLGSNGSPSSVSLQSSSDSQQSTQTSLDYNIVIITALLAATVVIASYLLYRRRR